MCDEGHKLKNPKMQLVKALKTVPAKRTLLLTGTPIQNNLTELWALMDLVAPGLLGDQKAFKQMFEARIIAAASRDASAKTRSLGAAASAEMRNCIASLFLRREKAQVCDSRIVIFYVYYMYITCLMISI
jgi:SNF2 family DNA or RNA helicase